MSIIIMTVVVIITTIIKVVNRWYTYIFCKNFQLYSSMPYYQFSAKPEKRVHKKLLKDFFFFAYLHTNTNTIITIVLLFSEIIIIIVFEKLNFL